MMQGVHYSSYYEKCGFVWIPCAPFYDAFMKLNYPDATLYKIDFLNGLALWLSPQRIEEQYAMERLHAITRARLL
jgi:hypothetical protein